MGTEKDDLEGSIQAAIDQLFETDAPTRKGRKSKSSLLRKHGQELVQLRERGFTYEAIAEAFKSTGFELSTSMIGRIVREIVENPEPNSTPKKASSRAKAAKTKSESVSADSTSSAAPSAAEKSKPAQQEKPGEQKPEPDAKSDSGGKRSISVDEYHQDI
jgi:hypothetical protein